MPKKIKLSPRQKLFCKAYLANGYNGTQAAITAGYSENSARQHAARLLTYGYIKEFLNKHMQKTEEKLDITLEWKLRKLKLCAELAMPETEEGAELKNHNALLGSLDMLNKMQGHYAPEQRKTTFDIDSNGINELIEKHKRDY